MKPGCLVAIVGPSGAGKDTMIRFAREALKHDAGFVFVRRIVTRSSNEFEDHDSIDEPAFAEGLAAGRFALAWRAHGLGYALPRSAALAVAEGRTAICNLSRGVLGEARTRFGAMRIVLVTAPSSVLAARLAARGRESHEAIAARLEREARSRPPIAADMTLSTDRSIEETGARLVDYLKRLGAEVA